jgi:hypothetical protein
MDPDLVRQQAEEEAASRLLARRDMPPDLRREPVLPMGMPPLAVPMSTELIRGEPIAPPVQSAPLVTAGWRTALGIATTCAMATTLGLMGGVMLGVKLHLVPLQSALVGVSSGFLMSWQIGALALRRGGLTWWRAYRVGFGVAFVVLLVVSAGMFVSAHYLGMQSAADGGFAIGSFWKSVGASAAVAILFGAMMVRRAFRIAADKR